MTVSGDTGGRWPPRKYAWYVVLVLALAYVLSYLDRVVITLLIDPIKADLKVNDTQISYLIGFAFATFYAVAGVPLGRLADRTHRRNLIMAGVALWTAMTLVCARADSYSELFLGRMGVGVGEAVLVPSALSLIGDLFPPRYRANAVSAFVTGGYLGAASGFILGGAALDLATWLSHGSVPLLRTLHPWQITFALVGLPGCLLVPIMLTILEPERRQSGPTGKDGASVTAAAYARGSASALAPFLLAASFALMVNFGLVAWLPALLMRVHRWSASEAGMGVGALAFASAVSAPTFAAWASNRLVERGYADAHLRAALLCAGVALPLLVTAPVIATPIVVLVVLVPGVIFTTAIGVLAQISIQLVVPNHLRATASACFALCTSLLGLAIGPTLVAVLTDHVFSSPSSVNLSIACLAGIALPISVATGLWGLTPYRALAAASGVGPTVNGSR